MRTPKKIAVTIAVVSVTCSIARGCSSSRPASMTRASTDRQPSKHRAGACGVRFTPDGRELISAGADRWILRWDGRTGKPLGGVRRAPSLLTPDVITVLPGCARVQVWSGASCIEMFDTATGALTRRYDRAWDETFVADGARVIGLTNGIDSATQLACFDAETGRVLERFPKTGTAHWGAFGPDGKTLAFVSFRLVTLRDGDGRTIWTTKTPRTLADVFALSPDGRTIVGWTDWDNQLTFIDATNGAIVRREKLTNLSWAYFSPDSLRLALVRNATPIEVRDVASGLTTTQIPVQSQVRSIDFSPDSRSLAAGDSNGDVSLYDAASGATIMTTRGLGQ